MRYVLLALGPARVRQLAANEREPPAAIKVCAEVADLARHLPDHRLLHEQRYLMTMPLSDARASADRKLQPGYSLAIRKEEAVITAEIRDEAEVLAASGKIAITPPYFIVDDIGTEAGHRRRGLGSAMMAALNRASIEAGARTGLLVATSDGHALYSAIGWRVRTPYASAYLA